MNLRDLAQGTLHGPAWDILDATAQNVQAVEPGAVGILMPAVRIFDRGEMEGAGGGKGDAGTFLHLGAEPFDAAILNRVFEPGVFAVGAVPVVPLGDEDCLADLIHLVGRDEAEHIGEAWEGFRVAVAHAESAADSHIITSELAVLRNGDESEILREDIDIVRGRDGEAGFEFAREVGIPVHRLNLGLSSGNEFLIEIDLMIGAALRECILAPGNSMFIDLLLDWIALGIWRSHDVTIHITAGSNGIKQHLMHSFYECLHISLEHPVELEGLPCGETQGG